MIKNQKVVVLGATGYQGQAVVKYLLENGWSNIHAVVHKRQPQENSVLTNKQVTILEADLDDPASLMSAFTDAYGVFSVIPLDPHDASIEEIRGKSVANAAKEAGVRHFVYSSAAGVDKDSELSHFRTKYAIEQHIQSLDLPASIVRPVAYMEILLAMRPQPQTDGSMLFRQPLKPSTAIQMICAEDIGMVAASMFDDPGHFIGTTLEIASDEQTFPSIAAIYQKVMGRQAHFEQQPIEEVRSISEDLAAMFTWFNEQGFHADIAKIKQVYPNIRSVETWFTQYRDSFRE